MTALLSVPPWLVALALAMTAPMCVRYVADAIERRARRRTAEMIARADAHVLAAGDAYGIEGGAGVSETDGAPRSPVDSR